jgi:glycosyltransferase involved in cell wall biosynthesis
MKHLFLNSNPWFSAVSDYSLQIAIYVHATENILYCSEVGSTAMQEKCKENKIPFFNIPIHNQTLINFMKSFFFILKFLFTNKKDLKYVWVFEGREHTLCSITKIIFPNLWRNKKLIRVRGQAQTVKSSFISKFIYNKVTDKVIFAANCVKKRVLFSLTNNNTIVHYYGKDISSIASHQKEFYVQENFPILNPHNLLFLVIGRFDPIKGHDYLVDAFLKAKFIDNFGSKLNTQLVFAGYKANINPKEMYAKYLKFFGEGKYTENKFYLESNKQGKQLFIIEEKLDNINDLLAITSFGIIPSLDSEVICRVGVEFLQCSIPVLSSDVGALPEVFSDFKNLIFKAGNVDLLTKKLEESSQLFLDKAVYNSLRKKAKEVGVDKYSSQNYKKLIDFVDD